MLLEVLRVVAEDADTSSGGIVSGGSLITFLLGGGLIGFLTAGYQLLRNVRQGRVTDEESILRRAQKRFEAAYEESERSHRDTEKANRVSTAWQVYAGQLEYRLVSAGIELPVKPDILTRNEDEPPNRPASRKRRNPRRDDDNFDDEDAYSGGRP